MFADDRFYVRYTAIACFCVVSIKKLALLGKQILKNNEILNRAEINGESNCFFTLKSHKDNFENRPQIKLINIAKNELGKISKLYWI